MRPEMVENGLKFLRHPNVQNTPLSERVSFLEQKGMTKEEIQEALERFQSEPDAMVATPPQGPVAVQAVAAAAPMVAAVAAPVQQLMRRRLPTYMRVILTISSVVGAATILGFLWNYMVHAGYFPWLKPSRRMIEAAKAEDEEATEAASEKEKALLTSLEGVSSAIQSQTEELSRLCATIDKKEDELTANQSTARQITSAITEQATVQAIAELKAEVSTLKSLLLSKQSGDAVAAGSVSNSSATTASVQASTASSASSTLASPSTLISAPAEPVVVKETSAQRMQKALKKFRQENTTEQLKLASGILIMYVKNLVENPDVPRYRRIAPANANFKQKIEPLKHHDELLKSIGFELTGLNMEWKWHLLDRANGEFDEHLAILKGLLKALQAVSSSRSSDPLALEEIAQQSLDEFYKQREEKKAEKTETEATATQTATITETTTTANANTTTTTINKAEMHFTTASTAKTDTNLEAFLTRLEQKTAKSFEDKLSVMSAAAEANAPAEPAVAAVVDADLDEEKAPVPVSAPAAASPESNAVEASGGEPPYPKSFTEVMEMLKKGETVPGIQEIEERISDDSAKFLTEETDAAVVTSGVVAPAAALPAKPWEKR